MSDLVEFQELDQAEIDAVSGGTSLWFNATTINLGAVVGLNYGLVVGFSYVGPSQVIIQAPH